MILLSFLMLGGALAYAADVAEPSRRTCMVKRPPESLLKSLQAKDVSDCSTTQTVIQSEYYSTVVTYTIPVVFHVLYKVDGTGNVSDATIAQQVAVLNEDFRAMANTMGSNGYDVRIQFELAGITRTQNDNWYNDNDELGYKTATAWDRTRFLNIWTNTAGGYLGYAYLAQDAAWAGVRDGVVLLNSVTTGRNSGAGLYDQGRTAVHEIGHYLGLNHTFYGSDGDGENSGCAGGYTGGDLINDTPTESTAAYNCVARSTCGSPDDISNYMNYTPDSCMDHFTAEQANRMVCSLVNYRPLLYTKTTEIMMTPVYELLLLSD